MKNKNSVSISVGSLLQVAFIVLKLCGVINWSWWWVLSPTLMSIAFVILFLVVCFMCGLFGE